MYRIAHIGRPLFAYAWKNRRGPTSKCSVGKSWSESETMSWALALFGSGLGSPWSRWIEIQRPASTRPFVPRVTRRIVPNQSKRSLSARGRSHCFVANSVPIAHASGLLTIARSIAPRGPHNQTRRLTVATTTKHHPGSKERPAERIPDPPIRLGLDSPV